MSIITLQLGQCGNQIGGQMFQSLMDDINMKPVQTMVSIGTREHGVGTRWVDKNSVLGREVNEDIMFRKCHDPGK
jgi:hypothetical protein